MAFALPGLALVVLAFALPSLVLAEVSAVPEAAARARILGVVPHSTQAFEIDGRLDDAVWRDALVVQLDVETGPGENVAAPVRTDAYLVENGAALLVAFDAKDPDPSAIRAYLRDRDAAFDDDFVGIVVDTFNDQRRAFEFFANALGVQMDLTNDDVNGREDSSWNAIWRSAGVIGDRGYAVEMEIPFSQLRFAQADGEQTWGIDVLRFYPRQDRMRLSVNPLERGRNCYLCQLGSVKGFAAAEPGKDFEIVPSLTVTRTDSRAAPASEMAAGDADKEPGLDVRWGILPSLTANLTLNPDFSQVEADVAQLGVNRQFALFFPETRPFFLEGADYFATPINAVFTRTVADPDVGAKLTGTFGDNTFGTFIAEDAVTNLLFPGALGSSSDSLDRSSRAMVGRYRRSVGTASTLGALVTERSAAGYRNSLVGVDGRIRIHDRHSVTFQYLGSSTEYPQEVALAHDQPAGSFDGDAYQVVYRFSSRNWWANVRQESEDPNFRADLGFVTQVDRDQRQIGFGHVWQGGEGQWWNRLEVGANAFVSHFFDGALLERGRTLYFSMEGPLQSYVEIDRSANTRFWNGQLFDLDSWFMYSQIRPRGGLNINMSMERGDEIDHTNSRLAKQSRIQPSVSWNVNRHALLRLQQTFERLDTPEGAKIYSADLTDLRLTWQFNLRSFLRFTVQRQLLDQNLAVFYDPGAAEPRSLSVGSQVLYSYQLNPETVLYAGYSNNQLEDDVWRDLTQTDRTIFLKFSYAWAL
ncbi:MAG TPA: DUF5916 domain-containing protein [Gammaproteobacteria bacterium]|nr:DUF5916 domain-containing protein [Gammaproteobacteria bacterium]